MHITKTQSSELTEIVEDTIEYFCDKELVSGQSAWTCIEALAISKLAELNGQLAPSI